MSNLACAEATCLWLTENFTDCHATLQKIESESKADLKLAHNLLVVEHVVAGSVDSDRIASQLELLSNERLAADDVGAADVGTASTRSRSSGTLEALPLVPVRDDLAVAQLNRAILLYRQHRYASAAQLLEPLAANVEALAEGTAVRVLTLLLDIYIEGRQLPRAVALLHSFERMHGPLTEAFAADRPAAAAAGAAGAGGAEQAGVAADAGAEDAGGGCGVSGRTTAGAAAGAGGGGGGGRPRTLALPRVSKWCSGAMGRSRALLDQQGRPPAVPDLKLLIKLYRSRLHALAHNTRAAKRELKAVSSALHGGGAQQAAGHHGGLVPEPHAGSPAATALLLAVRAQLELYRGRVRKATKLLLGMMQDTAFADTHRPLLLNNLGLVHHQQGKHTLALLYLSQALAAGAGSGSGAGGPSASAAAAPERPQQQSSSAAVAAAVPLPAVSYNAGLQHLLLHNYEAARKCFAAAATNYSNTPLLWLRTAEAALGMYHRKQQQHMGAAAAQQHFVLPNGSATGAASLLVDAVLPGGQEAAPPAGAATSAAAAARQQQQPRRLVLTTGAAPSPADVGPAAAALLSEAVVALQTALQQLDAQQEAHEQWQSSSSKLEEGMSLSLPVAAAGAAAAAGGSGTSTSAGAVGASSSSAPGESYVQLQPQPYHQPEQQQRPVGLPSGGEEPRHTAQHHLANGLHEPHGTDASAALSEELSAVRRAVLANLSYSYLQAEDWCAALQAAQALMAASGAPPAAAAAAAGPGLDTGPEAAAAAASAAEYSFLATSYAAEALCQLDRPADAVECLSLWLMQAQEREAQQAQAVQAPARSCSSQKSDEDGGGGGREEVYPLGNAAALAVLTGPAALAATYTNLAAVFASQGELAQAAALVRQALPLQPAGRSAALLLVYCELAAGNTPAALALLKQGQPMPL